ncbi:MULTISPECIES: inner membrane protein YhjD [Mycobacterium]|uniref:Inner membrane protein YhjD n=1 Tax=Mycobacterium kiyosense TaxID=2871094 RepID=A0A9P3Q1A7_9MYCO|nr:MULTISPECIES: inner membrane protein YhjD [Mycobacterium]BDE12575.1 inner membrane protein YhjD [Mycobacterium sp. 20KCMC460]GLB84923.1 inner membrane protein YhjD [Mycobacterium kiyosense]GLB87978.1 inner membrane protein YhjD [Mycobacterium kiyosense]GLB98050.1 inner membrane protein YhjD [Mycobacterium kiyosense]GLC04251.1 inner membrane protein YhjD [Mycobacterium kiyosense]
MNEEAAEAEPGILDRLRSRHAWLDHVMRAYQRFSEQNGGFFAGGLTYYTIFALFPLLMVGFASVGYLLSRRPGWLKTIDDKITASVSGPMAKELVELMNSAIDARTSVGIIGLATATWAGLGWISHLRAAISAMWAQTPNGDGYVRTKLSDLLAMLGTFAVTVLSLALSALGHTGPMRAVLRWLHIPEFSIFDPMFRVASILVSLLVTWLLFTWMIARLPREKVRLVTSMRAGLLAAVAFELFKQVASIYLRVVLRSPAGATFGPVLGLMVFANVTAYLVLFATAWAATTHPEDPRDTQIEPPPPAVISPRVLVDEGLSARQTAAALAAGAVGALTLSRFLRKKR